MHIIPYTWGKGVNRIVVQGMFEKSERPNLKKKLKQIWLGVLLKW
jgi:hypothetical protein